MHESFKKAVMHGHPKRQKEAAERESKEKQELFRATVGFDFVFDKSGKPHYVEINGNDSGIEGMLNLAEDDEIDNMQKISARIRSRRTSGVQKIINEYNKTNKRDGEKIDEQDAHLAKDQKIKLAFLSAKAQEAALFKNANVNPQVLEEMLSDKSKHSQFIPEEYSVKTFDIYGKFNPEKMYIIKNSIGSGGKGISITKGQEILKIKPISSDNPLIVQEFIEPDEADNGPNGHPASLRLLVDFRYTKQKGVEPMFVTGYQRVSPYSVDEIGRRKDAHKARTILNKLKGGGDKITPKDVYVVNKVRGAKSYPMSERELAKVKPITMQILNNLSKFVVKEKQRRKDSRMAT